MVDLRNHLPTFAVAPSDRARAARARIRIDGLVAWPLELTSADLRRLKRCVLEEAFVCEEGWGVSGLRWGGVQLADLVALAQPLPDARFVRACSGEWVVPIALTDLGRGLVCDELNGELLTSSTVRRGVWSCPAVRATQV